MASLPPGWEPDYDGSRWLYRYIPTGLTQFAFPQPGDEYPDFVAPDAGPITLAPEERLASEKQVKLRKERMLNAVEVSKDLAGDGRKDDHAFRMSATGYFDPSEFMYYEGADDDGELTPIAGQGGSQPRDPLGFVAELPSSDVMLCAEETAPVELYAGPSETTTTISPVEELDGSSITISLPVSASSPETRKTFDEDDMYSSGTSTQIQPSPATVSRPPVLGGTPHDVIKTAIGPAVTQETEPDESRFSFTPIPRPAGLKRPVSSSEPQNAVAAAPLVLPSSANQPVRRILTPGRSVDDIQAMPSSLQPHEPPSNRMRAKSATYEPWRPMIKFVQAGTMQESHVSTPGLSRLSFLEQQEKHLVPAEDTRMSAWLIDQALGKPALQVENVGRLDPAPSTHPHPEASVHQEEPRQICNTPKQKASDAGAEAVTISSLSSPLPHAHKGQRDMMAGTGAGDKVVESIIQIPAIGDLTTSRGVRLVDVSPGLPSSGITRRGAVMKKRFSWESETDKPDDEGAESHTAAKDTTGSAAMEPVGAAGHFQRKSPNIPATHGDGPVTNTPRKDVTDSTERGLPSVTHTGRQQGRVAMHISSKSSQLPSPRLPFDDGTLSPTRGHISSSKGVLVEPGEARKASIATFEAGPHKPLPPLPLVPQSHQSSIITPKQSTPHAFEQISELIAVANAAMPSARPLSARPPGPTAESVWRSLRTQASKSALSPDLPTTSFGVQSTTALNLPNRSVGHSRSISQLGGLKTELAPPRTRHSRSQSLITSLETSPAHSRALHDVDYLSQAFADNDSAGPKPLTIPAPTDGHKSHRRLSIHLTPAGTFRYHPLRSAPVLTSSAGFPERGEPQPVDYVKEQAPSALQLKSSRNQTIKPSRAEQPRLQVKMPFIGLPKSPRPVPKPQSEPQQDQNECLGLDEANGTSFRFETIAMEKTAHVTQRRLSRQSQVSSPTSSIFSTMRDSAVSAISSMADTDSTPLSDVVVGMTKTQVPRVEEYGCLGFESSEKDNDHRPTTEAETQAVPLLVSPSPTPATRAGVSGQRPQNISEAIRPAGTRASRWGTPNREEDLTNQVPVPTVIVRAPTVKLRTPAREETQDKQPPVPRTSKLPSAASENGVMISVGPVETSAQTVADNVECNDNAEQQPAPSAKQQSFMQSLRQSWQSTTSNTSGFSLLAGQGHTRSKSQSTLVESQEKLAEAVALAKKQVAMSWQWTNRDNWPNRESVSVDTGSISNVGAAIQFFNSSFQSRRPNSQSVAQAVPGVSRADFKTDTRTSTIVTRRVGPPVVVRMPC